MPKIKVIYENNLKGRGLKAAWGFSALIEFNGKKILFDAGGDKEIFTNNLRQLGIKPAELDFISISHKHWDHIAGLSSVLLPKHRAYLLKSFPDRFKKNVTKRGAKLFEVVRFKKIMPDVYTTGALPGKVEEQSLIIDSGKGLVIVTGCSHPGIVNIVRFAQQKLGEKIRLVLGGFHLYQSSALQIRQIIKDLKSLGVKKIAPCHCTGKKAIRLFQQAFDNDFVEIKACSLSNL
ncbi:hypothetical protein A2291_08635 [candidate division WOR-1 bacterium RIFOXYB2_FULL_42_35]|uniref:Uncharacterized protein n=1 Tax=candidate division WOR-1 bacterium RIFOXYC2_FULL_41_25 TaxID=1802586 RepID=A0A1F4TNM0_UNCSA|nr:MAG: hypothetical protein A2291_08635 [candidate division WOR-1 bacterium RIFOXYB2_FULL_42_35]OGC23071.1 MAG: hypothetical protein A2247_08535 [candidate division WOR-1 bacterium RIFOXYA2_FULL_41_14]OGC33643.1 MAG: hypothetical protein A2462_02225 [candidate division WOR-1 bacterium RIFOXYC2_FULL_41_25]